MNITNYIINDVGSNLEKTIVIPYTPDVPCFNWCAIQQVVHSNNMELNAILFVVFAYIFIILYGIADEIKIIRPYKNTFIYFAKLLLLLFLGFYIFIIRMRLVW